MAQATLQQIGHDVEILARKSGTNSGALRLLGAELKSGGTRLVGVDLLAAYPPELMIPDRKDDRSPLITTVVVIRDLLIFAPIAISWWSLHLVLESWAAAGYPGNLLQYWQKAPDGGMALSKTASIVVGILAAVAVLTLLAAVADRGDRSAALRHQLTAQLTDASLILSGPNEVSRDSVRQLAGTAANLGNSTTQLVTAIERVGTDLHSVANAGPGTQLHDALTEWRDSAAALASLGKGLAVPAAMMKDFLALRTSVEQEEAALRKAIQSVAERLEESTQVAVREGLAHTRVAEDAREATQGLGLALERFTERTQDLGTLVVQIRSLLIRLEAGGILVAEPRPPRDSVDDMLSDGFRR